MSKGCTSFDCYIIEARVKYDVKIGDLILTNEWKTVPLTVTQKPIGVASDLMNDEATKLGYLGWNQARSIEYQIHAELYHKVIGLETRLIQFRGETTYKFEETGKATEPLKTIFPATNPELLKSITQTKVGELE